MDRQEYQEILLDVLSHEEGFKRIEVPVEVEPGESDQEAWFRWMIDQHMIDFDEHGTLFIVDKEKIKNFDPNMLKILNALIKADTYARLDMMEDAGILYTSVDPDGNIIRVIASTDEVLYIEEDDE